MREDWMSYDEETGQLIRFRSWYSSAWSETLKTSQQIKSPSQKGEWIHLLTYCPRNMLHHIKVEHFEEARQHRPREHFMALYILGTPLPIQKLSDEFLAQWD